MRLNDLAVCFPFTEGDETLGLQTEYFRASLAGFDRAYSREATSARISFGRVWAGSITSSIKPRSAAT